MIDKRLLGRIDKLEQPDYELNSATGSMFYTSSEDYSIQEDL